MVFHMIYYIASVSKQIVDTSFESQDKEAACSLLVVPRQIILSASSMYWTGPFPGVKSPTEACALGWGSVCSLKTVNIKNKIYMN